MGLSGRLEFLELGLWPSGGSIHRFESRKGRFVSVRFVSAGHLSAASLPTCRRRLFQKQCFRFLLAGRELPVSEWLAKAKFSEAGASERGGDTKPKGRGEGAPMVVSVHTRRGSQLALDERVTRKPAVPTCPELAAASS